MIRSSLNSKTYLEYAKSSFLVARECLGIFLKTIDDPLYFEENRLKQIGFFRSSLLHFAITIELVLKSLALHHEKQRIESGELKSFNDFLKNLKKGKENNGKRKNSNGHDYNTIIKKYNLDFDQDELNIINSLQEYAIWAGRFPYPTNDAEIEKLENINGSSGPSLSLDSAKTLKRILKRAESTILEI